MVTAKSRWEKLNGSRDVILERARDAAELTIPALMPREGHNENSRLPQPYQSLGARGLNNLSSKLTLALVPAGNPFFRLQIADAVAAELQDATAIQDELQKIENRAMRRVENSNLRTNINVLIKLLASTGNALLFMPDEGGTRVFRLTQYCVVRDAMGNWREIVIEESVHPLTLDDDTRAAVEIEVKEDDDDNVKVYTHVSVTKEGKVEWYQEINDIEVPESRGRVADPKDSPYIPLRWTAIENEDYGRGHVEEYIGDLRSLEGLSKSIVQFSAAAAKVIFLERPNSSTDIEALQKAESGEFVEGNIEDVNALQIEKFADFQVAKSTIEDLTLRLSHAFLLTTGTVRNAERVTAEEIRLQAQELEDVLGGVYTVLAQELQLPIVRRLMVQMRKAKELPNLPKGAIEPVIVTGFDALGRGHELNKMRSYFGDLGAILASPVMEVFSAARVADMLALQHNVDIEELKKTEEESAGEQQQGMAQTVMDKATGPVAGAAAKATFEQ